MLACAQDADCGAGNTCDTGRGVCPAVLTIDVRQDGQNPVLQPSCQSVTGTAVPAIRIKSLIDRFGSNGLFNKGVDAQGRTLEVGICSTDFTYSMSALGQRIATAL